MGQFGFVDTLAFDVKKSVVDQVEQEYLAYLFLNNSNAKLHSQLKKEGCGERLLKGEHRSVPHGYPQGSDSDE